MPATLRWKGKPIPCDERRSILDCLLEAGISVANSCRAGACQACVVRAIAGQPPEPAQKGLPETLRLQGYFLSCQAPAGADLDLGDAEDVPRVGATVASIEHPAENVVRLRLRPDQPVGYRAGQFVHVIRDDGLTRSYSLASLPADETLELHVKRLPGGAMSGHLVDAARVGDRLALRGPLGHCFYVPGRSQQPLLLAGTGTGLAPLLGIARDALARGHEGPIELHHGALDPAGLYAHAELEALAAAHPNFHYLPCVLQASAERANLQGDIKQRALARVRELGAPRVFLCGPPELVNPLKKAVFLAGVALADILSDPFVTARAPATAVTS